MHANTRQIIYICIHITVLVIVLLAAAVVVVVVVVVAIMVGRGGGDGHSQHISPINRSFDKLSLQRKLLNYQKAHYDLSLNQLSMDFDISALARHLFFVVVSLFPNTILTALLYGCVF
uniref:Uncharacterized protein n=1 Tax=Glossina palpalis gambiensis TaxID=67801 RepID=A0A1B0BD02_9MUSC